MTHILRGGFFGLILLCERDIDVVAGQIGERIDLDARKDSWVPFSDLKNQAYKVDCGECLAVAAAIALSEPYVGVRGSGHPFGGSR